MAYVTQKLHLLLTNGAYFIILLGDCTRMDFMINQFVELTPVVPIGHNMAEMSIWGVSDLKDPNNAISSLEKNVTKIVTPASCT